jgi:hypothetical protein
LFLHHATAKAEALQPGLSLDDIETFYFFTLPFLGFRIEGGVNETLPILVITGGEVRPVVESRIAGFFTEFNVTNMCFYTPDTMVVLPTTEKLMKVTRCHLL